MQGYSLYTSLGERSARSGFHPMILGAKLGISAHIRTRGRIKVTWITAVSVSINIPCSSILSLLVFP